MRSEKEIAAYLVEIKDKVELLHTLCLAQADYENNSKEHIEEIQQKLQRFADTGLTWTEDDWTTMGTGYNVGLMDALLWVLGAEENYLMSAKEE